MSFRKTFSKTKETHIKSSDAKKLKQKVKTQFPLLSDADMSALFPSKCQITIAKCTNHVLLYLFASGEPDQEHVAPEPTFFIPSGKVSDPVHPSVYTMWRFPHMVPALKVHHHITKFIFRGADLMLPGVYPAPISALDNDFQEGDLRCICVIGNPAPVAIGRLLMDSEGLARNGMKGRGLEVSHWYSDHLWQSGSRVRGNPGFGDPKQKVVTVMPVDPEFMDTVPDDKKQAASQDDTDSKQEVDDDDTQALADEVAEVVIEEPTESPDDRLVRLFIAALKSRLSDDTLPVSASDVFQLHIKKLDAQVDIKQTSFKKLAKFLSAMSSRGLVRTKTAKGKVAIVSVDREHAEYLAAEIDSSCGANGDDGDASGSGIDELLEFCVKVALKTTVTIDALPMSASTFFTDHMSNVRIGGSPVGSDLDVKKSSFKKLAKFLKHCQKQDLLKVKEQKGKGLNVISVNAAHPSVAELNVEAFAAKKKAGPRKTKGGKVQILHMFKPSSSLTPMFEGEPRNLLYTVSDAKKVIGRYIDQHGLAAGRSIRLDPTVTQCFFARDETIPYDGMVTRPELAKRFEKRLHLYSAIVLPGDDESSAKFKKGPAPKISFLMERRMGRKVVTLMKGLEQYGIDPEEIRSFATKKFACSCSCSPIPTAKKTRVALQEVLIQGNFAHELAERLSDSRGYGVPPKCIEIVDRSAPKAKLSEGERQARKNQVAS